MGANPSQTQIFSNRAKPGQARPREIKEKRLGFAWIPLSESSLFSGLQRPPGAKILFRPSPRRRPSRRFIRRSGNVARILVFAKRLHRLSVRLPAPTPPVRPSAQAVRLQPPLPQARKAPAASPPAGPISAWNPAAGLAPAPPPHVPGDRLEQGGRERSRPKPGGCTAWSALRGPRLRRAMSG
jgi:hypothetical protein